MTNLRIGHGYDVHKTENGLTLTIGGVKIPSEFGLAAHSDGDVLCHAVIDALFGAAGMTDIGAHFPDTDMKYKGVDSMVLLRECVRLLTEDGWQTVNIDSTIIAQAPKMKPYIGEMRTVLSENCGVDISQINVKATTEEHLGFTGSGEGIAAHCVCIIEKR